MTARFDRRRLCAAVICLCSFCAAASDRTLVSAGNTVSVGNTVSEWRLAALPFAVSGEGAQAGPGKAVGELLPKLLLQQLSGGRSHMPLADEIRERRLSAVRLEMQKLFLELSQASREKDAVMLLPESEASRAKKLKEVKETIADIQTRLDAYIESAVAELDELGHDPALQRDFPGERVVLWNESPSALFMSAEAAPDPAGVAVAKKAADEQVQGVIAGSVRLYAGYMAVTAQLFIYPGAQRAVSVTEIGAVSDMVRVAEALAVRMLPAVLNELPVDIRFAISPAAAAERAVITFDTERYLQVPEKLTVGSGIHSVTIEAEGYKTRSFTWDFNGAEEFTVSVNMPEMHVRTVQVSSAVPGSFWLRGIKQPEAEPAVTVNDQPVLGLFVPESGEESFFYIPDTVETAHVSLLPDTDDLADKIERKRKWMYTAYTALILSLPAAFFCYGTYVNEYNAAGRYTDGASVDNWKLASDITAGCSIALGVHFLVQLGIYLYTANKVIPAAAEPAAD